MLTSFLAPLTLADVAVTYNGTAQSGTATAAAGVLGAAATGTNAGSYSNSYYSIQQGYDISGGNLTINPAALNAVIGTLTGSVSKVYDGTDIATLAPGNFQLTGWLGSDGATVTKTTGTYTNGKDVGTALPVVVNLSNSDYSPTGSTLLSNYSLPSSITGNVGVITPRSLTVTAAGQNKVYDGTTNAGLTLTDNRISGDNLAYTYTASFTDRHVGTAKNLAVSNLTLSGTDAGNYSLTVSGTAPTANITPMSSVAWTGGASGNWSNPANWAGGALPDGNNVLAVSIPSGSQVTFDGSNTANGFLGYANLNTLASQGALTLASGTLGIGQSLSTPSYAQTGGTLSGAGTFTANGSFSKTGGVFTPTGLVSITQSSGNLSLTNEAPITFGTLLASAGDIDIDNTGGITTTALIKATSGHVHLTAHSPITIGSGGIEADTGVSLAAPTSGSSSTIAINGAVSTAGGGVGVQAGNDIVMAPTASVTSSSGNVSVQASGNITLASINAGSGSVAVQTTTGQIGSATPGSNNITAAALTLDAATGIQLTYVAPSVTASSTAGTVAVTNSSTGATTGATTTTSNTTSQATTDAAAQAAADAAAKAAADAAAQAAADAAAKAAADAAAQAAADAAAKAAADAAAQAAADAAAKAVADAAAQAAADAAAKAVADAAAQAAADAAAKAAADAATKVATDTITKAAADAVAQAALAAQAATQAIAQAAAVQPAAIVVPSSNAVSAVATAMPAASASPADSAATTTTGTAADAKITSTASASANTASSSDKVQDKVEEQPAAKQVIQVVSVGNSTVQKPVDQIVQADRPQGRQFVCR
jgi:hypothetical protein